MVPVPVLIGNIVDVVSRNGFVLANVALRGDGTFLSGTELRTRYEALGVDYFCYAASFGMPMAEQKKSLRLFAREVIPEFEERSDRRAPTERDAAQPAMHA